MSVRIRGILCALTLTFVGCSGAEQISREDAVAALETTGVTEAEATCMADTLITLDRLDAADPRRERSDATREAFLAATTRCVAVEVLPEVQVTSPVAVDEWGEEAEIPSAHAGIGGSSEPVDDEALQAAVDYLVSVGRSPENAQCIVGHLVLADAQYVLGSPNFGLGLDPFEADAMAMCLSVEVQAIDGS